MSTVRGAVRAVWQWATDWRTGLAVAATGFVALLIVVVVTGAQTTKDALDARQATASAATRRIDRLNDRIEELGTDLVAQSEENGERIGELTDQVAVLQEQVRQLGGDPVVVVTTTSTTRPTSTTSTSAPPPTTTTTTQPPPEEPEPDDGTVCVLGLCIGG